MLVRRTSARLRAAIAALIVALGAVMTAAWIPLKAELAQVLIERSWRLKLETGLEQPPWPWADTYATARLTVPSLEENLLVLSGASGRNLAFGPVLVQTPGMDRVISGHRDTHFSFLERLKPGDVVRLQTAALRQDYRVSTIEVVDSRYADLVIEPGTDRLSLVTCYPFDAVRAGGPLRYVVTALPVPSSG